jgi:hypothetical protein
MRHLVCRFNVRTPRLPEHRTLQFSMLSVVDIVSVSMLLWIASGLYMWWEPPGQRRWGSLAILAGVAMFTVFTLNL